jgi:Ca2+:H+ antiporter
MKATEEIALRCGSTVGSVSIGVYLKKGDRIDRSLKLNAPFFLQKLMNATFGNAVELILGVVALQKGLIRVVQGK